MGDVEKYIHASPEYPQLVRLALVHYQFEAIHPFFDGHGRVGRLLLALLAVQWNLLPSPLLYLSAYSTATETRTIAFCSVSAHAVSGLNGSDSSSLQQSANHMTR